MQRMSSKRHGICPNVEPTYEGEAPKVDDENTQTFTNIYTEKMTKRYAYESSPRKKRNWFKFVVLAYVIMY